MLSMHVTLIAFVCLPDFVQRVFFFTAL